MITQSPTYVCVITYRYEDRVVEIPGNPKSRVLALADLSRDIRLTFGSERVVRGVVYSEADYKAHQRRLQ